MPTRVPLRLERSGESMIDGTSLMGEVVKAQCQVRVPGSRA